LFYFFVFRVSSLWLALCNIGSIKDGKRWDAEEEHPTEVRELGKSKWSEDFEDDIDQTEGMKGNINALSGLIHQYGKERKSVHWGDQV
jgi:YLP motif-containing protein 1